ncbi:GNAT family N-acetyltransferase [Novosphingobium panipatense]|jgi:RimJ/RimL family protein N-acetyltransferase|uniref:GNAT family N-acetyltransferase n=1 Tax=Novosphingobium TaxID=165696 RepID=UPI000CDAF672|nr:GNAT family N-acetyltransferase [Novosphingobium sp. HII-3]
MFVRTERLFLRPAWPEDLDDLVEILAEEDIQRNLGVTQLPRTADELRVYLNRPRDLHLPHFFMYLRSPTGAELVGGIGLGRSDDNVEVGYWIAPRYRGRGFASEALRAVINQARTLGHRRIVACHFADSWRTGDVLESAGFRDTGELRPRPSASRGLDTPVRVYVADLSSSGRTAGPPTALNAA